MDISTRNIAVSLKIHLYFLILDKKQSKENENGINVFIVVHDTFFEINSQFNK